jgi:hypothetical protein
LRNEHVTNLLARQAHAAATTSSLSFVSDDLCADLDERLFQGCQRSLRRYLCWQFYGSRPYSDDPLGENIHARYVAFQMAEIAIPRNLFAEILRLIAELRPPLAASTA